MYKMNKTKLFCIPFAGGSSFSFANWVLELRDDIQIIPVELSGKGAKAERKFHKDLSHALDEILEIVREQVTPGEKYAFFGHSMGALLTFELYYVIRKEGLPLPEYLVLSAVTMPDRFSCKEISNKSLPEFKDYIGKLGGLPAEVLKNEDIKGNVLKTIKKDYEIMETYSYSHHECSIECPGYILHGSKDKMTEGDETRHWSKFFRKPVKIITVEGDHFFINKSFLTTINIIKKINTKKI